MPQTGDIYNESEVVPMYRPADGQEFPVQLVDGTYVAGQVLGLVTASSKFANYADANADGTQTARCILRYPCTVASGVVTIGEHPVGTAAPAYFGGTFATEDLTGLDAAAVTDLGGRLLWGSVTNGVVKF